MSEHCFADLFKQVLFPLFEDECVQEFLKNEETAMNQFSSKFEKDHKSIQMLQLADRVKYYNFNRRSVQDEMFTQYMTKYATDGIMTLEQFICFLDDHMIK